MLTAIVGANWGDEGKGRMVDLLAEDYEIVVRYQGGNNAGHTVINDKGRFILNLLPSGIFRDSAVNVMGVGMVIDIEHLCHELDSLLEKGIAVSPERLKISDKAVICLPYHVRLDRLEEQRLADKKFGSTQRGIAPVYSDKYMKKAVRMGDLLHPKTLAQRICDIVEWKNLTMVGGYHSESVRPDDITAWLCEYGDKLKRYICDTTKYLSAAVENNKNIMFEAQLGALRDIDYGIYPYTSSSSTIAAYAPIGAGIPMARLDRVVGIVKAYSSCVGEGPFTCELFGEAGDRLREAGGEYGAATGRPRRVGGFDAVATKYGVEVQGATELALTKLDVLSYMDKIPVCVAYNVNGKLTTDFPSGDELHAATPVYEYLEGFKTDIGKCRKLSELPDSAIAYIRYIEKAVNCPVRYVSVGAERDDYIEL